MERYDLVVIGGGSGNRVARAGASDGLNVALVEKESLGGACLTRGCDPSKALIHRADIVSVIETASALGIEAEVTDVAFAEIVDEVTVAFEREAAEMERSLHDAENLTFYTDEARFVDERTIQVGDERIAGEKIVIATGTRPRIPGSIDGTNEVAYSTSRDALRYDERPEHLLIVGGGYIAAELGHLYGSLGSDVTVVGHADRLLNREDRAVAETITDVFERRYTVHTGYEVTALSEAGDGEITVTATRKEDDRGEVDLGDDEEGDDEEGKAEDREKERITVTGDEVLIAAGREPNTDRLNPEAAGVELDEKGYVVTDETLETTATNVWALGDVIGERPFKHAATHEARFVVRNALGEQDDAVEYPGMAHAIYTDPPVASTGATEGELEDEDRDYVVGRADYDETAMGWARRAEDGFVKVLASAEDGTVLGCHVVGPQAPTLIHQVTGLMAQAPGTIDHLTETIHVHPAMNEVLLEAFEDGDV